MQFQIEPGAMTEYPESSIFQSKWKHIWIRGFMLGVGAVLIGFLVWFSTRKMPPQPPPQVSEKAAEAQVQPDQSIPAGPPIISEAQAESATNLKSELEQVLSGIKEANQSKDLSQLLSHYSPNFPQLPQRAQQISRTWKSYDYTKMDFDISEVRLLPDKTAVARVIWHVEMHNISTQENKEISRIYTVRFVRESGQWRIKALDRVE